MNSEDRFSEIILIQDVLEKESECENRYFDHVMFHSPFPWGVALKTLKNRFSRRTLCINTYFVIENATKRERYIRNNKRELRQGGIYLDAPDKLLFEYTRMAFVSLAFMEREPKEVLFVGLGAGSMPKYFH